MALVAQCPCPSFEAERRSIAFAPPDGFVKGALVMIPAEKNPGPFKITLVEKATSPPGYKARLKDKTGAYHTNRLVLCPPPPSA